MTPQVDAVGMLRAAGLQVTGVRLAALDALAGGGHLSADEVVTEVRERLGAVSTQAEYDVLRALAAAAWPAGRARRLTGSPARYEARAGDNHQVVCRSCGAMADVDCAVGGAPCLEPAAHNGFVIGEAEVTYWGAVSCLPGPAIRPVPTKQTGTT